MTLQERAIGGRASGGIVALGLMLLIAACGTPEHQQANVERSAAKLLVQPSMEEGLPTVVVTAKRETGGALRTVASTGAPAPKTGFNR